MDMSNMLKPKLARGELQLVGATTLDEYRLIEKDAALARRFQSVFVAEPTVEDTVSILRGRSLKNAFLSCLGEYCSRLPSHFTHCAFSLVKVLKTATNCTMASG